MSAYKVMVGSCHEAIWEPDAGGALVNSIEAFLNEGGVDPASTTSRDETGTSWIFQADPGFSIILRVYSAEDGKMFFILEAAITRIAAEQEGAVTKWLALMNRQFYDPLRLGLTDDGAVVTLVRGRADGLTPSYLNQLVRELIPFSQETLRRLQAEFPDLKPFYNKG